ncbi:MAG: class I SAM-dependent methyltransferase [Kiritimatiellae bacterium]|jgi:hypothetical protein|nr:class I SAM-dependent methyltransferase [Kiritimatiellia bacterium]MDD4342523.1 class I SAM-dependent methyltransferase [Kiritimatiellia bacterium]MDY0150271.1 class I SAM-dependent methyltransferase [Kiritimatiellia bacterium]
MNVERVVEQIVALPPDWHGAGSLKPGVLKAMARHGQGVDLRCTAETGSGKSSLLFSHLARRHLVFAMDDGNGSVRRVQDSPLLQSGVVEFIEGPTQQTLPTYDFSEPLQMVMLDGPHGYPFPHLEYYYVYPHLAEGGVLIVDDIDIPSIYDMYRFLKRDDMFALIEVVHTTAFFRRTAAPVFNPLADGWWLQGYNKRKKIVDWNPLSVATALVPRSIRKALLRRLGT